jgi:hypothetical protein
MAGSSNAAWLAVLLAAPAGCAEATGSLVGGDSLPSMDAGEASDAALTYFSTAAQCPPSGGNANTWQFLYGCYFGPTGVASCSFQAGNCHGGSAEPGSLSSGGYVCGTDPTACWQSMTSALVSPGAAPATTTLYGALRKSDGTGFGNMPAYPTTVVFQSRDMARISAWITAGAKND